MNEFQAFLCLDRSLYNIYTYIHMQNMIYLLLLGVNFWLGSTESLNSFHLLLGPQKRRGRGRKGSSCFKLEEKCPFVVEYVMFLAWKPAFYLPIMLQKSAEIDDLGLVKSQTFFVPILMGQC